MKQLNPNRSYTYKVYKGNIITDDRFEEYLPIRKEQDKRRDKLIKLCKEANIELDLHDPRLVTFPASDSDIEKGYKHSYQWRSAFYVKGNYPDWYFYQTVNQVKPMPLDKV